MADQEQNFVKKLSEVNASAVSIQTLSNWMHFNKSQSANLSRIWNQELMKARPERKLTLLYLANDVVQNARKKGSDYRQQLGHYFPSVFVHLVAVGTDAAVLAKVTRLIDIWAERGVYEGHFVKQLKGALTGEYAPSDTSSHQAPRAAENGGGGGAPQMTGPAAQLAVLLSRKESLSKQCESLAAQKKNLRKDILAAQAEGGVSATPNELKEASLVLDMEKAAIDEHYKVIVETITAIREILKDRMAEIEQMKEAKKVNEAEKACLEHIEVKQSPAQASTLGGGKGPPPPTASDDENDEDDYNPGEMSNKRQKIDDPDATP